MALTLLEASKQAEDPYVSAVIETYAKEADILKVLPFVTQSAVRVLREKRLPTAVFRGLNEGYTADAGELEWVNEHPAFAGGDIEVDISIIRAMGEQIRATREVMKIKALAQLWAYKFVKGDSGTDPKEFDGLQVRCVGNQLVPNATSGEAALSLYNLDKLIDTVDGANFLLMNKALARRLTAAARTTSVGGFVTWDKDEFGQRIPRYNDLQILIADRNSDNYTTLAFDEAGVGSGTSSTSVYALAIGDGQLQGMQAAPMDARDLGEKQSGTPALVSRVDWDAGIVQWHPRSIARLYGITDAAVTA